MAKPPVDADPEQFILGHGGYDNLRTARPYNDDHVFRIDPAPVPILGIVFYDMFFAAVFFLLHWLLKNYTGGSAGVWAVYVAPIGIGLMTCVGFSVLAYRSHDKARRLGPWLVYNKALGGVELPRIGMSFEKGEIVHLQYVTTKRLDWGGVTNNQRLSELNLITLRNGERKRWPLLRSTFQIGAFDYLLKPLVANTALPVLRVKDEVVGWKISEKQYNLSG